VGDLESEHQTANLRTRNNIVHGEIQIEAFLKNLEQEKKQRSLETPYSSTEGQP
jgi:threonyl-tRNA synthetase